MAAEVKSPAPAIKTADVAPIVKTETAAVKEPSEKPPAGPTIDIERHEGRFSRLLSGWEEGYTSPGHPMENVDAIVMLTGKQDEPKITPRVLQLQLWLTGYFLPETIIFIVLKTKSIVASSGPKKLSVLGQLSKTHGDRLKLIERKAGSEFEVVREALALVGPTGVFGRFRAKGEEVVGQFSASVDAALKEICPSNAEKAIDSFIGRVLSIADSFSLPVFEMSATLSIRLMKEGLMSRVVDILDQGLTESHAAIVQRMEKLLDDDKKMAKWQQRYGLDAEFIDPVYALVNSTASGFSLRPSGDPSPAPLSLSAGCVCLGVAGKYKDMVTSVGRTLLLDAGSREKQVYKIAMDVFDALIGGIKDGIKFCDLYRLGADKLNELDSHLEVPRNFGNTLSTEFRDPLLMISSRCEETIVAGMVLHIMVAIAETEAAQTESEPAPIGVLIADSVVVLEDGSVKNLTEGIKKGLKDMLYELNEEADSATTENQRTPDKKNTDSPAAKKGVVLRDRLRSSKSRNAKKIGIADHERIMETQRKLRSQKTAELRERFTSGTAALESTVKKNVKKMNMLNVYRDVPELPRDMKPGRLYVDKMKEALLVPIMNEHVPFHISTIRSLNHVYNETSKSHSIRINFQIPGASTLGNKNEEFLFPDPMEKTAFVKELIVHSGLADTVQIYKTLQELQKRAKSKDSTNDVESQQIQLNRDGRRRVLLKNLMFKSTGGTSARRVIGTLEAHITGLRYQAPRLEPVDIAYSNIKHAFFQPAEKEFIVVLHFHLKMPIMVNRRKAFDVQFFQETGSQVDDIDGRRGRSTYDPDEIAEEERDAQMKERVNNDFKRFVEGCQTFARIDFEVPVKELQFNGVPGHSNVVLMPTANALVSLLEWPVFVVTLEDIEVVSFERVMHGLRAFDMIFVFKDYNKAVKSITAIPVDALDTIKRWLTEMDIVWYEGKTPLNWSKILKTIREDIDNFLEGGGFSFLSEDSADVSPASNNAPRETVSDSDEEDGDYGGSTSEDEASDEDSSDEESLASEDSDEASEEFSDEDEVEEEGLTWEELEKEAKNYDRKRNHEDEQEVRRTQMKKRKIK